jgi:hypothetical protein
MQVVNAAPNIILWKKSSTVITIRLPGLYRVSLAFFTMESAMIMIYVNDEPILSANTNHTNTAVTSTSSTSPTNNATSNSSQQQTLTSALRETNVKRFHHSIGEITSVSLEEYLSLPPEARITIRYHAHHPAQGFIAFRKL